MPENTSDITDYTIAKAMFLAFNEYFSGNFTDSLNHMDACDYMIELKGGAETLGLDGFLWQLITWFREELYIAKDDKDFLSQSPSLT
ncbi:hypothetical protein Daus18300_010810 [Diaporthe australafricana]|uniref:Uncharacterized protein n=1 Tax=Diaporthe australafricana TaxID=127596 RepID=A0ABR3W936_9PEZI